MDSQFVTTFKEEGTLRLSSFAAFKQHKDEHRGDKSEGHALAGVNDVENDKSFFAYSVSGTNAYVLSTTMRSGPDISQAFGASSFEIFELIGFSAAVANEIPGCTHTCISQCIYVDQKVLISEGEAPTIDDMKAEPESNDVSLEKVLNYANTNRGPKPYFLKDRVYEWQAEYRFIWETNKRTNSHIYITAPELRNFCKF